MATPYYDQLQALARNIGLFNMNSWAARRWLQSMAQRVQSVDVNALMRSDPNRLLTTRTLNASYIGKMIMYFYDPKTKKQLPYYDRFPLIFPVDLAPRGFYGINLHYLSPYQRAKLFDALFTSLLENQGNEKQRLRISYGILKSTSRLSAFRPCFKRYLTEKVRSKYYVVDPAEWSVVMMLPTERFEQGGKGGRTVGSPISKQKVWAESAKKI